MGNIERSLPPGMTEAEFHERWATYWRDYARIKDQALVDMREELKSLRQQRAGAVDRAEKAEAENRMLRAFIDRGEYFEDVRETMRPSTDSRGRYEDDSYNERGGICAAQPPRER